jgi:hypothetical protein
VLAHRLAGEEQCQWQQQAKRCLGSDFQDMALKLEQKVKIYY